MTSTMEGMMQYPPGDSRMIDIIVHQLKSQGIFDQFRKECLADVDTKPAYQNLHQRVEGSVTGFLASQEWRPDLNKNQLRDSLRKHIHESGFLDIGVERIVDQVVNPKIMTVFMPQVEDVVYKFLGIEKPKKGKENQNVYLAPLTVENLAKKEQKKLPTLTDLLPKELEPISPESDTLKGKEDISLEDGEVGFGDEKEEEDSSPPFEPIEKMNTHIEESSLDSHLSGISELTSHGSQHSHSVFNTTATPSKPMLDLSNNDSQLSKVSSGSRLSIVSLGDQDFKLRYDAESNDESQHSKFSMHAICPEAIKKDILTMKEGDIHDISGDLSDESNSSSLRLQIYTQENSENNSLDAKEDGECENDGQDNKKLLEISENNSDNKFDRVSFEFKTENKTDEKEENVSNKECNQSVINDMPVKDEIAEEKIEIRTEEKYVPFEQETSPKGVEENDEKKPEVPDVKHEHENIEKKLDEKPSVRPGELFERKLEDKCDKHERKVDEKTERKSCEKPDIKLDEKLDRKVSEKSEKKLEEKHDRKVDGKSERKVEEKHTRKIDEKSEKKCEKKYEKQSEEKAEKRSGDKTEKKIDEKSTKKSDDKSTRKIDEKKSSDKRLDDKSDRKIDERKCIEKKSDEKRDKKADDRTDRRPDKKHDKHRDERDKSKDRKDEKKRVNSESRDTKKNDSSHSSESDKRKSDKEKLKKDHGENRSKSEKSYKHDNKEAKDKSKCEEKVEKDISKEKSKNEMKDYKDDKKTEEKDKKSEKDSGREKSKKEETVVSKHDKEIKKSRSDDRKDRDGKERQKTDERGRTKHDDKHREKIRSEGREKSDKDRSSHHDDKSKNSSRSSSKENKDRSKQDGRKETQSKSDEKKYKDKLKHDEKSNRSSEKGNVKKSESKSRSSDHKSRESGKKNKESKGKSITDDHRIHRDKHSEDRRSADRDSNGTTQDRPIGNAASHTNGSDSQPSQSRRDKTGSTSTSSKSDSGGNSDSSQPVESSRKEESYSPSKSSSPPSSLPFKKRPLSIQSDDERSDNEKLDKSPKPSQSKIKKPKIAANIFEVKKIMMLRKSLAKKERKQQRELKKNQGKKGMKNEKKVSKPVVAERKKLGDVEKSLRKEVDTSLSQKQIPVVDIENEDISDFKYFETEIIPNALNEYDSQFLAYVKQLVENDNLSDVSIPSESESVISEDDVIRLSDIDFDEQVAKELQARFVNTNKGVEVVFDESSNGEVLKRRRASMEAVSGSMVDFNIIGDTVVTLNVNSRPNSATSNSSEKSADYPSVGNAKRRRERSTSAASINSIKSISDKVEVSPNDLNSGKHSESNQESRKKIFSRKRPKRDFPSPPEIKPIEKRELRRSRKPNTRYSSKEFASYTDGDASCDRSTSESVRLNNEEDSHNELKSDLVVVLNDFKTSAAKVPPRVSHEDEDSSDGEVILECVGDGYDIIRDNNNVDKGSSEDERGCGDGPMLNQDLILPTLRDLMVESGFRREDDKSDILATLVGVGNCLPNNNSEKQVSNDSYGSKNKINSKRTNIGRSRRVGLSRPRPKVVTEQGNNEVGRNRTATPPDFVMPLSPESDVSASSGEAKKALHEKVGESHCDPSASNSNDKTAHVSNSQLGDTETRRSLRSGGLATPGVRGQRYNSDELYKPRPLFSQGSRRIRGRVSPPLNEDVPNCTDKLMSGFSETPLPSAKKRR